MIEGLDESGSTMERERATALYTFLKEFTELRSRTVRTIDQYEQVLLFADVPREVGCDCAAWHRGRENDLGESWLEIRQPRLERVPDPPEDLVPWLIGSQLGDSSLEMPELREEIAVPTVDEFGEEHLERHVIEENVHVREWWERYVEDVWWPWAEVDRKNQIVQRVYTDLFSIYQKQQRLGEQYEVVVGLGLLYWRPSDGHDVQRHLVTAKTSVSFDAARGIMTVGPAGEGAKSEIEQDMLDPTDRPDPMELRALAEQVDHIADQIWDPTPMDAVLSGWVRSASSRGVYSEALKSPESTTRDPVVHLAPALILRKRTERSFLKAFEEIIRQLEAGQNVPEGVGRFVTIGRDRGGEDREDESERAVSSPEEIYFPLESNDAQRQIVERLATNQGVLVQGPPGTGKSHTIVNLVCHLLATGQRVLVTSHTARALRVLQRYIGERAAEISPLAVVLLGDDRDSLQAMEDSVQGITSKQNQWDGEESARRIAMLEQQLDEARRQEATVLQNLRAIRESETFHHSRRFGGYEGTLLSIASRIRAEEKWADWIEDRPAEGSEPPLTSEQFRELLTALRDPDALAWEATGRRALVLDPLASPDRVSELVASESAARDAFDAVATARSHPSYRPLSRAEDEVRKRLIQEFEDLLHEIELIRRHLHEWTGSAVVEILGDHDRAWRELFTTTTEHLGTIGDRARWADEIPISWLMERDHHEVRADAESLLKHFEGGGGWGLWPFRAEPAKRALYLRREVKIGGRPCESEDSVRDLVAWLEIEERLRLLRERWAPFHRIPVSGFSSQVRDLEDLCEPLESALGLHERVARIRTIIQGVPGLSEPVWHESSSLETLVDAARAVHFENQLGMATSSLSDAEGCIAAQERSSNIDPAIQELHRGIRKRDVEAYRTAFSIAESHREASNTIARRDELLARLVADAPNLAGLLQGSVEEDVWEERADCFQDAWNWARATAWIEALSDPDAERQFRLQLDLSRDAIRKRLEEIASEKAWFHCFERMEEHERQHLVAWAKAVRRIGKGTGKYAPIHRRNAREHMNECRSAIPAWVMPLYRVAETIHPGTDLFDVVIVDEASQSGPEALLLAYLAKKMVVVGDDKQISPTYAGINHEDVNQIRARHIDDLPHSDSYGVHASFFDLAEIRYQGRIRLREHFRCMPEIIQFSNKLCYASEPLIPLRQYGESRLSPVVSARPVRDGYLTGIGQSTSNPPEADAIVDEILSMHGDPRYQGKSFGVISLLGQTQARVIESKLLERLGPEGMEERQLVCGDAYAFQGDERDVMFLSLVSAPSAERRIGTLTQEADKRRFNVAASRARDQLLLFHTATLNDLSPKCFRYALLEYCQNPSVEMAEAGGVPIPELQRLARTANRDRVSPPEPFDSWFEVDVLLRIVAKGYRVLPQYEVARYRIDLVVEGMTRRLAVECDGDFWHGPDQYDADMARQRMLERCGWKFWRVRGSAFELDPDGALEDLWTTLEREGIYTEGSQQPQRPIESGEQVTHGEMESSPAPLELEREDLALGGELEDGRDSEVSDEIPSQSDEALEESNIPDLDRGQPETLIAPVELSESSVDERRQFLDESRRLRGDEESAEESSEQESELSSDDVLEDFAAEGDENAEDEAPADEDESVAGETEDSEWIARDSTRQESQTDLELTSSSNQFSSASDTGESAGYVAFAGQAGPDPRECSVGEVADGLVRIVEIEGPILAKRTYDVYLRGCDVRRMGKEIKKLMNRALQKAVRDGLILSEDEDRKGGLLYTVLRMPGSPAVNMRERGPRVFGEIPSNEIQAVAHRVQEKTGLPTTSDMYLRAILEELDLTRLTPQVQERLVELIERAASGR